MNEEESEILDYPQDTIGKNTDEKNRSRVSRVLSALFFASFLIFLVGNYLKNKHSPFGTELLIAGCLSISVTGILRNILKRKKTLEEYFLAAVFALLPVGFLFNAMRWQGGEQIFLAGKIVFLVWLILKFILLLRKSKR